MEITILGSGSSTGVPAVDRGWGNCNPSNPKNQRTRSSIFINMKKTKILVDTSPDLRAQLLASNIKSLNAVIFTHAHADHLHGIDDLRAINRLMNAPIEMFADGATLDIINTRFKYTLEALPKRAKGYFTKPTLLPNLVNAGEKININNIPIQTFDQDHGFSRTLGLRISNFAYSTDLVELPENSLQYLTGLHTWVIGVFSKRPHLTHVHLDKALDWIEKAAPKRAILTHLGPELDFEDLKRNLPEHVLPAFDGQKFSCPD